MLYILAVVIGNEQPDEDINRTLDSEEKGKLGLVVCPEPAGTGD